MLVNLRDQVFFFYQIRVRETVRTLDRELQEMWATYWQRTDGDIYVSTDNEEDYVKKTLIATERLSSIFDPDTLEMILIRYPYVLSETIDTVIERYPHFFDPSITNYNLFVSSLLDLPLLMLELKQ